VRFDYGNFGLEGAVGAIKARVLEAGGIFAPLTALKRAELVKRETQYLKEKQQLRSPFSRDIVETMTLHLFTRINELCAEIEASGTSSIEVASDAHGCHLRNRTSLAVTLDLHLDPHLIVCEYDKKVAMRGENAFYLNGRPEVLRESKFLPDMNRAREHGWSQEGPSPNFLSSADLADRIVSLFIDLCASVERGVV
jgi:hypothetical protein